MARIRSIHPGLYTDEIFMGLTVDAPLACTLLTGLWNESDDQGVFEWKPLTLKARILPAAPIDVLPLLSRLIEDGLVKKFDSGGRTYGAVRNFRRWQRPEKPKAVHPLPNELRQFVGLSAQTQDDTGTDHRPVTDQSSTGRGEPPQRKEEGGDMKEESKPRARTFGGLEEHVVIDPTTGNENWTGWEAKVVKERIIDAALINDATWTGDFRPVIKWLADGIDLPSILAGIRRCSSRESYRPPKNLSYFKDAIAEEFSKLPTAERQQSIALANEHPPLRH